MKTKFFKTRYGRKFLQKYKEKRFLLKLLSCELDEWKRSKFILINLFEKGKISKYDFGITFSTRLPDGVFIICERFGIKKEAVDNFKTEYFKVFERYYFGANTDFDYSIEVLKNRLNGFENVLLKRFFSKFFE